MSIDVNSKFNEMTFGEIRMLRILLDKHLGIKRQPGDEDFEKYHGDEYARSLHVKVFGWLGDREFEAEQEKS